MRVLCSLVVLAVAGCNGDLVMPDDVTPGEIGGPSADGWWMGMPPVAPGELALDARLTIYTGTFVSFDTIDVCRGACRHIGYGGDGLLALDNANEGIQLVGTAGVVATTLPFPLEEIEQAGPWVLAGRGSALAAAAGTHVFLRDGDAWSELPELDAPVFAIDFDEDDTLVARRETADGLFAAPLVGDEWVISDDELVEGELVAFDASGKPVTQPAAPEADTFVPLRMFESGLLGARLVGTTLDAVIVGVDGAVTSWAPLGSAESVNPLSFRATVFDDGTVGVLYPGAPREEGVGPKTVLHAGPLPE